MITIAYSLHILGTAIHAVDGGGADRLVQHFSVVRNEDLTGSQVNMFQVDTITSALRAS